MKEINRKLNPMNIGLVDSSNIKQGFYVFVKDDLFEETVHMIMKIIYKVRKEKRFSAHKTSKCRIKVKETLQICM
tara:strand:+ start:313 stop:537 length:225 start_codon:yes stop_codon:yes gene_type:complete